METFQCTELVENLTIFAKPLQRVQDKWPFRSAKQVLGRRHRCHVTLFTISICHIAHFGHENLGLQGIKYRCIASTNYFLPV